MSSANLKYLFTALLKDGSYYSQNEEDVSIVNLGKSSFFDILEAEKAGNPPQVFCLTDKENNSYLVDLRDGHFDVNNTAVINPAAGLNLKDFRLIYFRTNFLNFTTGEPTTLNLLYKIGWQANDENGKNYQYIMEII